MSPVLENIYGFCVVFFNNQQCSQHVTARQEWIIIALQPPWRWSWRKVMKGNLPSGQRYNSYTYMFILYEWRIDLRYRYTWTYEPCWIVWLFRDIERARSDNQKQRNLRKRYVDRLMGMGTKIENLCVSCPTSIHLRGIIKYQLHRMIYLVHISTKSWALVIIVLTQWACAQSSNHSRQRSCLSLRLIMSYCPPASRDGH